MRHDVVNYDPELHLHHVQEWWGKVYSKEQIPPSCLPNTGAVAVDQFGRPKGICFVYFTEGAKMAIIALAMADPSLGSGRRVEAVKAAIEGAVALGKKRVGEEGFVWSVTDHSVVARIYDEIGLTCAGEADVFFLKNGDLPSGWLT